MKLGIFGTGAIMPVALTAMQAVPTIAKKAIFARAHSRERAKALATQYHIENVYTDAQRMLQEADIDTIYVALTNVVHYAYAKMALLVGKHVIVEKPFCSHFTEAEALAKLAREQQLILLEAMPLWHSPVYEKVFHLVPKLGPIRLIQCNYSQYSSRYDRYLAHDVLPSFDPAQCGGALYDLNVYNIAFATGLFGSPETVRYLCHKGWNGVDTSGVLLLSYPGFTAVLSAAKDSESPSFLMVQGENGWLQVPGKPIFMEKVQWAFTKDVSHNQFSTGQRQNKLSVQTYQVPQKQNRMTAEFREYARIIDSGDRATAEKFLTMTLIASKVLDEAAGQV